MAYNYITNRNSPNFTKGRTQKIKSIVIHWWGDPKANQTVEGVVNWLCNPSSKVSAHYVITGTGRQVYHLVDNVNTAWHAKQANPFSIGLELDPRCRDEDYDVAAEVIANIWGHYGYLPLEPHSKYVATACPGNYDLRRLENEAKSKMVKDTTAIPASPAPAPAPTPTPTPTPPVNNYGRVFGRKYINNDALIGRVASFLRKNYPAYTPASALGNYFGPNIEKSLKEFQRRTGILADGNFTERGETMQMLRKHGFKG